MLYLEVSLRGGVNEFFKEGRNIASAPPPPPPPPRNAPQILHTSYFSEITNFCRFYVVHAEHMYLLSMCLPLQSLVLDRFVHLVEDAPTDEGLKGVLSKLCDLYGLWSLDKHLAVLYQG